MQKIMVSVVLSIPLFLTTTASSANQANQAAQEIAGTNIAYAAAAKCYYYNGRRVCEGAAVVAPGARVYRGPVIRR